MGSCAVKTFGSIFHGARAELVFHVVLVRILRDICFFTDFKNIRCMIYNKMNWTRV